MATDELQEKLMTAAAAHIFAFERREQSRAEINYGKAMRRSAIALANFAHNASFEQLLSVEKSLQQNDLNIYAKVPSTIKAVREGINDFQDGEEVYKQLLTNPEAYKAHKYREKERTGQDKSIPLDAMRRALRGQAARVGNYRKNVMGNEHEFAFMNARIAMIRRAETMYDEIQRRLLLPSG